MAQQQNSPSPTPLHLCSIKPPSPGELGLVEDSLRSFSHNYTVAAEHVRRFSDGGGLPCSSNTLLTDSQSRSKRHQTELGQIPSIGPRGSGRSLVAKMVLNGGDGQDKRTFTQSRVVPAAHSYLQYVERKGSSQEGTVDQKQVDTLIAIGPTRQASGTTVVASTASSQMLSASQYLGSTSSSMQKLRSQAASSSCNTGCLVNTQSFSKDHDNGMIPKNDDPGTYETVCQEVGDDQPTAASNDETPTSLVGVHLSGQGIDLGSAHCNPGIDFSAAATQHDLDEKLVSSHQPPLSSNRKQGLQFSDAPGEVRQVAPLVGQTARSGRELPRDMSTLKQVMQLQKRELEDGSDEELVTMARADVERLGVGGDIAMQESGQGGNRELPGATDEEGYEESGSDV